MGGKNDEREEQKRQFVETKPMESFDEINGIVERNQWNSSTKPMDLFRESVGFSWWKRQNDGMKTAEKWSLKVKSEVLKVKSEEWRLKSEEWKVKSEEFAAAVHVV